MRFGARIANNQKNYANNHVHGNDIYRSRSRVKDSEHLANTRQMIQWLAVAVSDVV